MLESVTIEGIIYSVKIDREGESKITFSVPQSEIEGIILLSKATEKLLKISVKSDE